MIYWDSSALVASFILEPETTKTIRSASAKLGEVRSYTSIITPLEVESAIQRRLKEQSITSRQADEARLLTTDFRKETYLVVADQNVLDAALHLQKIYGLRPADAIQLASARTGTEDPSKVRFFCLDERLNESARREGFHVLP